MSWGPFSAEAVALDTELRRLHRLGRVSEALGLISDALAKAHAEGPSNLTYAQFEAEIGSIVKRPSES